MSFKVIAPRVPETPVVVEVPHAGLSVDALTLPTLAAPIRSIGVDADLYVDQLYAGAPDVGATLLVAEHSRYVCDLNRSEHDVDPLAVVGGTAQRAPHGLIWRDTTEGQRALYQPLSREELERRLVSFYRPYHQCLAELLAAKRAKFGFVVLLAGHSMPSRGRPGHADTGRDRADVVPGSRGRTTAAAAVIELPERIARPRGWTVIHDDPYRGGYTTAFYGRPERQQHALQVELSRRLYMNEATLEKKLDGFEETREFCTGLVAAIGSLDLGAGKTRL
ncbi:MAG TPA: N-formylglutamate amidohydrolase [Polyangiaceae bacterium]|nr:N-formylglutamate amidohydrolase [Polyangiaceae bacterium]